MTSTSFLAKLGAAAAVVAAPAMLFLGVGSAQAFGIQMPLAVWGTSAPALGSTFMFRRRGAG